MKRFFYSLMAVLLAVVIIVSAVPAKSYALVDNSEYYVKVGGWKYNESTTEKWGDGYVSYDADTHTLTLDNATISGSNIGIVYGRLPGYFDEYPDGKMPFTIVLKGKNYIETADVYSVQQSSAYGIRSLHFTNYDSAPLIITGNGTLNIEVYNTGGYALGIAAGCGVTIKKKAKVNISLDDACSGGHAMCLDNEHEKALRLEGSAKLTAYAANGAFYKIVPEFGKKYTPMVKAGKSSSDIKVNKKKPSKKVYEKYEYISIRKK